MTQIKLTDSEKYQALFNTSKGLVLSSFKIKDKETLSNSQEAWSGLVYPHFPSEVPHEGEWEVVHQDGHSFEAKLEEKKFDVSFSADITQEGLICKTSIISESDSLVGMRFSFPIEKISAQVAPNFLEGLDTHQIHNTWDYTSQNKLTLKKDFEGDFTFYPFPNPIETTLLIEQTDHTFHLNYALLNQENSWQYTRSKGKDFVILTPMSAKLPLRPNLSVSSMKIRLY